MWFSNNPTFMREAQAQADRQSEIIKIMTVFPAYHQYRSHPTYEQFKQFVERAEQAGYSLESLYPIFASGQIPSQLDAIIFASGQIPSQLDAIIKESAVHWRPSGEIVEGKPETNMIE